MVPTIERAPVPPLEMVTLCATAFCKGRLNASLATFVLLNVIFPFAVKPLAPVNVTMFPTVSAVPSAVVTSVFLTL